MTMETLREDLVTNLAQAKEILGNPLVSTQELATHLLNTMWPTLENIVDEMDELDEGLYSVLNGEQDILQLETGKAFMTFLVSATQLVAALRGRINRDDPQRLALLQAIATFDKLALEVKETLELITVSDEDDDEDAEDDEEAEDGEETDDAGPPAAPEGEPK